MKHRKLAFLVFAAVVVCLGFTASAEAVSYMLGNQDFADGYLVNGGVAEFEAASADDPPPFDHFNGSDFGAPFSANWTFNYPATPVSSATLTIGIFDHDSQASGSQVASFDLEGNDLTAVLYVLFEFHGGAQVEANVYSLAIPGAALGALADGSATFSLTLKGPGLQSGGPETDGNGAGLDFARLEFTPVPEPTGLFLLSLAGATLAATRRKIAVRR